MAKPRHGFCKTRFYKIWKCIKHRKYKYNVSVCNSWKIFENFRDDMFHSYSDHCAKFGVGNTQIDRIDFTGDYSPENCRWATLEIQANNKRNNRILEYNGIKYTMAELSRKTGTDYFLINLRLRRGWTVKEAVEIPKLKPHTKLSYLGA
jgi:hypothetical protein